MNSIIKLLLFAGMIAKVQDLGTHASPLPVARHSHPSEYTAGKSVGGPLFTPHEEEGNNLAEFYLTPHIFLRMIQNLRRQAQNRNVSNGKETAKQHCVDSIAKCH
jgi:hypothetical protein